MVASLDPRSRPGGTADAGWEPSTGEAGLRPGRAALLGLVQGASELLPVSSSAHLTLIPWLAGWRWDEVDPEARKSLEVFLHAGAAAALLIARRKAVLGEPRRIDAARVAVIALSSAPSALAGRRFERSIERRLGGPAATAAGLLAGALAMALADRCRQDRRAGDAGPLDGLALGLAQATALAPGVSRSGATLAAARARRFARRDAYALSRAAGVPVIAGATALRASRLRSRGSVPGAGPAMALGAAAAFASTLASLPLARRLEAGRSPLPYALYRAGLAAAVGVELRRRGRRKPD